VKIPQLCIALLVGSYKLKNRSMRKIFSIAAMLMFMLACSKTREVKNPLTGKLIEKYEYYEDDNGSFIKDGEYKSWFPNEQIKISGTYKDNKKEGVWKYWDENGNLLIEVDYENDLKDGKYKEYYATGNIKQEAIYSKDTLNGIEKTYFPNGAVKYEINFVNGVKNGVAFEYDSLGNKRVQKEYLNGSKTGKWILWDSNSVKIREIDFENDVPKFLIGLWKDPEKRKLTYEFKKDGIVVKKFPIFEIALGYNDPITTKKYFLDFDIERLKLFRINSNTIEEWLEIKKMTKDNLEVVDLYSGISYKLKKVK
tara:strand:- start:432 stop:1361 length:930 start_codon:yes stop_codon:yes gene_type:complete